MSAAWLARYCRPDGSALDRIRELELECARLRIEIAGLEEQVARFRLRFETVEKGKLRAAEVTYWQARARPVTLADMGADLDECGPVSDRLDI